MSRYVSFGVLLAVIVLLCVAFYRILAGFLVPMFLAALLVVIFRPIHNWIVERCKGRKKVASLLTTLSILLVVLIPMAVLITMAVFEGKSLATEFTPAMLVTKAKLLRQRLGLHTPVSEEIRGIEANFVGIKSNWTLIESHQVDWQNIEQFSKRLQSVTAAIKPEKNDRNPDETKLWALWTEYESQLKKATEKRTATFLRFEEFESEIETPENAAERQQTRLELTEMLEEYHDDVNTTASAFKNFKNRLLGGQFLADFKMAVNPGEQQVQEYGESIKEFVKDRLLKVGGATTSFVFNLLIGSAIMVISLYFFLLDGPAMIQAVQSLSPLDDVHEKELVDEFGLVSRAVVVATLLSALVQGLLAGIGYYFCGFDSVILLTILTAALAMVPFFGAASVWVPASLYLYFFANDLTAAVGLAIYGAAIVSMADNVIKPLVLHGQSNIHPLFALLSILGGVSVLGPVGLLVGPMVVAFLQTLLKILRRELSTMENAGQATPG